MVEIGGSSGRTKLNCPKKYEFKGFKMWLVELNGPANVDEPHFGGCGTVYRAIASATRGLRFVSS